MKTFRKALQGSRFPITAELSIHDQTRVDEMLKQADLLAGAVDAIQIAEKPSPGSTVAPTAMAALLIRQGIDPVLRLTCRDRNRIALQSDLLGLRALGVSSLILNKGSQVQPGSERGAKPVFDLSCRELVAMVHALNEEDWIEGDHEFLIGTRVTAFSPDPGWNNEPLLARASAGARFLQTQPCFDPNVLRSFLQGLVESKLTWSYSVIVTLAPLPSVEAAHSLCHNHPGTLMPDAVIDRMGSSKNPEQEGVEICAELMREIAGIPGVSGINLITLGNPEAVIETISAASLKSR